MAQIIKKYQAEMKHIATNGVIYHLFPKTLSNTTKVSLGTVGNDMSEELLTNSLRKIYEKFDTLKPVSDTSGYISTVTYASTAKTVYPTVKVKKTLKTAMAEKATSAFGVMCDHNSNILLTTYINFNTASPVKSSDDYNSSDDITKSRFITPSGVQTMFSNYTSKLGNYYTTASKLSTARYSNTTTKAIYYNLTTNEVYPTTSGAKIERAYCKKSDIVDILVSSSDTSDEALYSSSVDSGSLNSIITPLTNGVISKTDIELKSKCNIQYALGLADTVKFASRSLIYQTLYPSTSSFQGNVDVQQCISSGSYGCKISNNYAIFEDGVSHPTTGVPLINTITVNHNNNSILPFEYDRTVIFIVSLPISKLNNDTNDEGYKAVIDVSGQGSMVFIHPAGSYDVHLVTSSEISPPCGVGSGLSTNNIYIEDNSYKFSFNATYVNSTMYPIGGWNIMTLIV